MRIKLGETSRRPLIAIIGSVDPARKGYQPPVRRCDVAREAAEALGVECANQGCRIIVYSADPSFVEADVTRGFLKAAPRNQEKLIQVRFPLAAVHSRFGETQAVERLFDYRPETDSNWEAAFYRSLRDTDGVLLIGGGRSTLIIGHVAIANRIPVAAVAGFGGAAEAIWRSLRPEQDLVTEAEWHAMARPEWRPQYAAEIVASLRERAIRRLETNERAEKATKRHNLRLSLGAVFAVSLLILASGMAAAGSELNLGGFWVQALLLLIGPCAGAASALVRTSMASDRPTPPMLTTAVQGFCAGGTAALLYLLAQYSTAGETVHIKATALLFALAIGILAGFTFDKVLRRMAQAEVPIPVPRGRS